MGRKQGTKPRWSELSIRLFYGGSEITSHRAILTDMDVKSMAMSYIGLRRRVKFAKPWRIEDKFDPGVSVFLDSGAYTINADSKEHDLDELEEIAEHYKSFVTDNIDSIDLVSEFDAIPLGFEWISAQREDFWKDIPRDKFMVIWHPVWGIPYLNELAEKYAVIGIPETSLEGRNLRPMLNALAAKGTRLHGIGTTKIEEMKSIRWDSVSSNSWISPQHYGDTFVWTGNELKRYPKRYKATARKRHRTLFTQKGFDAAKIANDDSTEVLRLSVWSWKQFEEYVNKHHKTGGGVTPLFTDTTQPEEETDPEVVVPHTEEPGTGVPTPGKSGGIVKYRKADTMLPGMGIQLQGKDDDAEEDKIPILNIRSESSRVCNSCFLSEKCPMYEPDSNCAYNIPVTVRTREQFKALQYGMLEMQTQRVMFMRFAEDMEGGYADPNLSKEMGLLQKMMETTHQMEQEGFDISLRVRGQGAQAAESGMFSNLFGREAAQKVMAIEGGPIDADELIVDAELVGEDE